MQNLGTAPVGTGTVRVNLPPGYGINGSVVKSFDLGIGVKSESIPFSITSPVNNSPRVAVTANLSEIPKDLNIDAAAAVSAGSASVFVRTADSQLAIESLEISEPAGAQDSILSTAQLFTLRAVVRATANFLNRRAVLQLPELSSTLRFQSLTDLEQEVVEVPDTLEWKITAPTERVQDPYTLTLGVYGIDGKGEQSTVKDFTVLEVVDQALLSLDEFIVVEPQQGVMQDGEAYFSLGQSSIVLQTRVLNDGVAQVSDDGEVELDLMDTGFTLSEGTAVVPFRVDEVLRWTVNAPDVVTLSRNIRVRISNIPKDENTGLKAQVSNRNKIKELTVNVDSLGWIGVDSVWISNPSGARDYTLSAQQEFKVSAQISSERVSEILNAQIYFSDPDFEAEVPTQDVASGANKVVRWDLRAPEDASLSVPDSFWVSVSGFDLRSGVEIQLNSEKMPIRIEPRTLFTVKPKIAWPPGLTDQIATGQAFQLTAEIERRGAEYIEEDSLVIELLKPAGYSCDQTVKAISGSDIANGLFPTWEIIAPEVKPASLSSFILTVLERPRDANSGQEAAVRQEQVSKTLQVVDKAQIQFNAYLDPVAGINQGSVRIGNAFTVTVELSDIGEAGFTGSYEVEMLIPPEGYTTSDTLIKSDSDDSLTWTILAPAKPTEGQADTLVFRLLQAPLDKLAGTRALVIDSVAKVIVTAEIGALIADTYPVAARSSVLRGGLDIPMLGLVLRNKDVSSQTESIVKGITLHLRNKMGQAVSPASVVTRIAAARHSEYGTLFAERSEFDSSNRVQLDFFNPDTIRGSTPDSIDILVDIAPDAKSIDFQVAVDSASALLALSQTGDTLIIVDSEQNKMEQLGFGSGFTLVVSNDLDETFCNYPNPFGNMDNPTTRFIYTLKKESDVSIRIFTLTGNLVRALSYTVEDDPVQTSAGLHDGEITWDGTNGQGVKVRNGVYLAYIITGDGLNAMTKIAVVK